MVIIIKRQRIVAGISGFRPREMIRNLMVDIDVDPKTFPSPSQEAINHKPNASRTVQNVYVLCCSMIGSSSPARSPNSRLAHV